MPAPPPPAPIRSHPSVAPPNNHHNLSPPLPLLSPSLPFPKNKKLHTHRRIHDQHPRRPKPKRQRARDPLRAPTALLPNPAAAFPRREVGPGAGIRQQRGGVEQVAEKRGGEESRGEAGGAAATVVLYSCGRRDPR